MRRGRPLLSPRHLSRAVLGGVGSAAAVPSPVALVAVVRLALVGHHQLAAGIAPQSRATVKIHDCSSPRSGADSWHQRRRILGTFFPVLPPTLAIMTVEIMRIVKMFIRKRNLLKTILHPKPGAAAKTQALGCVLAGLFLTSIVNAQASTHVWTGNGQGNYWSEPANWQAANAPQSGEAAVVLTFPPGGTQLTSTNDLAGLQLDQLTLSGTGYLLAGTNALSLSSNLPLAIQALGLSNGIALPLLLQTNHGLAVSPTAALSLAGCLSGPGGFTLSGGGLLDLTPGQGRDNTYAGPTYVLNGVLQLDSGFTTDPIFGSRTYSLAVPGALIVGPTNGSAPAILRGMALSTKTALTLRGPGQFQVVGDLLGFGSLEGDGLVDFQGQSFQVGYNNTSTVFSGQFTNRSEAGLHKVGPGSLTLSGKALSNVALGVSGGRLIVDGDFSACTTVVSTDPSLGNTGSLEGNGRLGLTLAYGTIRPGHDGPGQLTCESCDMSINSRLVAELGGTRAGIDYDQLVVTKTFGFETADPVLEVRLSAGFVGSVGNHYTIVRTDGTNPVSGHFNGLPESATVKLSTGAVFRISYQGGDGNDIVLTQLVAVPFLHLPLLAGNGQVLVSGRGSPGATYTLEASSDLGNPAAWLSTGTLQADPDGSLSFTDLPPIPNASRYYRLHAP